MSSYYLYFVIFSIIKSLCPFFILFEPSRGHFTFFLWYQWFNIVQHAAQLPADSLEKEPPEQYQIPDSSQWRDVK